MTASEIKMLAPVEKHFAKGRTIVNSGDSTAFFGIVSSGSIHVFSHSHDGTRNIILTGRENFVFGQALSLLGTEKYPVTVTAAEDCSIVFINKSKLSEDSSKVSTAFLLNIMKIMAKTELEYRKKINILSCRTTREKLLSYLYSEARLKGKKTFSIPYDRQSLADYLNVDRSAMSSEIGKLVKEGIIKTEKNLFTVR